ncbi:MAG: replicative DNA helicase [Verrucomicrobia bacterium]|nr:replicative DNA helicase [Verrucomicrobiota bacterium]
MPDDLFSPTPRRNPPPRPVNLASIDRHPPHSIEAEQGVLGCILLAADDCVPQCLEMLHHDAAAFYDLRHQTLYDQLLAMHDEHLQPVEMSLVVQRLRDRGMLEGVGGVGYLANLANAVPSAANLPHYLAIVHEKRLLRRVLAATTTLAQRVHEMQGDVKAFMDDVEKEFMALSDVRITTAAFVMKDVAHSALGEIDAIYQRNGAISGLPSGFPMLDRMTDGFHGGEMIVIAARPSMGKTSLAMNMAEHAAIDLRIPVGVFSLEMTSLSLVKRLLLSRARINPRDLSHQFVTDRDFERLKRASETLADAPLFIDDAPGLTVMELRGKARRMVLQHQVRMLVIDYLQLLRSDNTRAENRQQEIAYISSGIKSLAKELNIPILVLSQLNRDLEREKRKPRLSDLRESGSIEQDADLVTILYREKEPDKEPAATTDHAPVNLLVAKHRNGPTGDVPLVFFKSHTRFESGTRVEAEDVPKAA